MAPDLPDGHTARPAALADAEAVFALVSRHNTAVVGFADCTLSDVRDILTEPGLHPETDSWLVLDAEGTPAAFAVAVHKGTGQLVEIDLVGLDERLHPWLYARALTRADQIARAGAHPTTTVTQGVYRDDSRMRTSAAAHGLTPATAFFRMRVDHQVAPPPCPVAPPGLTLRFGPGDERFRRTAHAVLNASFQGHYGWLPRTFDRWQATLEAESVFDWSQLTLAELDGVPVAILVTTDAFLSTDDCGYVADLGVLPEARGRGIAKYLLRTAFAADRKAGRAGTLLHVDSNNVTPALDLYRGVGMRPVLVIDSWRTSWPTGGHSTVAM